MNSITATYPGFQSLPKGIKRMLVVSENLFFEQAKGLPQDSGSQPMRTAGVVNEIDLKAATTFRYPSHALVWRAD